MRIIKNTTLTLSLLLLLHTAASAQLYYNWAEQGGSTGFEISYDIATDINGNVFVTGTYEGDATFTPNPGPGDTLYHTAMSDIFLAKYDASGNYQWAFRIIGDPNDPGNQNQIATTVATDLSGNVYISGRIDSRSDFDPVEGPGDTLYLNDATGNGFIAKYDSNGGLIWAKNYGGSGFMYPASIQVGASGNIYLHGYYQNTTDFDPGPGTHNLSPVSGYDLFLASFDSQGELIWANGIGGSGNDFSSDMAINDNEDLFMWARFENSVDFDPGPGTATLTSAGSSDPVLARYDSSGAYTWAISIAGTGSETPTKIDAGPNDLVVVAGYHDTSADFDPSSATHTLTPAGVQDGFIARYDGSGNLNWAFNPSGVTSDFAYAVNVSASARIYLSGSFYGAIDLDPSTGTTNFTAPASQLYVAEYDSTGNYVWGGTYGGASTTFITASACDTAGNLLITGGFMGAVDMDPDTASTAFDSLPGIGSTDIFIQKLDVNACLPYNLSQMASLCAGDSLLFGGTYHSQGGTYVDTLQTVDGCDSIINLQLTLLPVFSTALDTVITPGDSVFFGGGYFSQTGIYTDTLIAQNGCDSIVTLDLSVSFGLAVSDDQTSVNLFPNPAYSQVHVSGLGTGAVLMVVDLQGRMVGQFQHVQDGVLTHGLNPGIYLVNIIKENGDQVTRRLVIMK